MNFENKLALGRGIYTIPDIALILDLPYAKVRRTINEYWDGKLGKDLNEYYSWTVDLTRAVSFHTLIEFYTFFRLSESGAKTNKILEAHKLLSKHFNTAFPFAKAEVLKNLSTDGKSIFFNLDSSILTLDKTKQFNLDFIKVFFKKIEFDNETLASKFWPLGKEKAIICDPGNQFGLPTIAGTNIYPETIHSMFTAGDPISFIAKTYDLQINQVKDALEFCKSAA